MPIIRDLFEIKRRKLALRLVFESKVKLEWFAGLVMSQRGFCLARIMIAIVVEKNDLSPNFSLQPASGLKL